VEADSPDTWTLLTAPPTLGESPIFALAVDPASGAVLVGTGAGALYRSTDHGLAWTLVIHDRSSILTIAFNPYATGHVLAGTQSDGIWSSTDAGVHWSRDLGSPNVAVRSLGFARSFGLAGTDHGVLINRGSSWVGTGLEQMRVDALAVPVASDPAQIVVGGDFSRNGEQLPLYQAQDAGTDPLTWNLMKPPDGATGSVAALAAGPVKGASRPLLLGTSTGAWLSPDSSTNWTAEAGLPGTDFNVAVFGPVWNWYYLASDGGGSVNGGLWSSGDFGATFKSFQPPVPTVSAVAVSSGNPPELYVATYRPADHAIMLWSYQDAGGAPNPPTGGVPPVTTAVPGVVQPPIGHTNPIVARLEGPEGPYLAVGAAGLLLIVVALLSGVWRRRHRRHPV
jgi:hypothetical protein